MWNYSFEIPILLILGIVLAFYFSRPVLPIRRNYVFLFMILIDALAIFADMSASQVDSHPHSYDTALINILNMIYFVAYFIRSYILYLFAATVMKDTLEKRKGLRQLIRIPAYFGVLMSIHAAISGSVGENSFIYYVDGEGYHSGNLYNLVYAVGFIYILLAFISQFLYRDRLGRRREKYSMLGYNLIILAALVLRWFFPQILIMDTLIFMAILVVFLAFENPEYYLNLKGVVFNSAAFREHLEDRIGHIKLVPFGVVVHNYLEMRDVYGASQMEEGLAMIGRYLKQLFPRGIVFYTGNGRFVVLVRPETDFEEKSRVISEKFSHPWVSKTIELYLSAGFVIFDIVPSGYQTEIVFRTMTKALDAAGRSASDEVCHVVEEDIIRTEKEIKIRKSIEKAIEQSSLELYLQPIVDSVSGMVVGAEALSRIRDEEGKIIPPGIFIPVAENSGRINELGELVFEKTCRFLKEENLNRMGIKWINVNLSPVQFVRTNLAERYAATVEKYGIEPAKVHLEITESSMIDDSFLQQQMSAMLEKGFRFALDDYGTGYSNLARLKTLPFANVKIDMSIVRDYCKKPDAILPNMIETFKFMGFHITAEGIEDAAMAETMKNIGCDYLQGYHYSKPLPEAEFVKKYSA